MKPKIDFSPGMWYTLPGDFMYNEAVKERFLTEHGLGDGSHRFATNVFAEAERLETALSKDLAEMTVEEATGFMESFAGEVGTAQQTLNILRRYVEWCRDSNVFESVSTGFTTLKPGDLDFSEKLKDTLFRDEIDMLQTIRSVRTFDEGFPEPPFLCLCWLGLKGKECLALKDEDVDLEARAVSVNGEIIASGYSDAIAEVFGEYVACKSAERDHKTGARLVLKDYSTGLFLKKMLPRGHKDFGKPIGSSQMSANLSRLNTKLEDDGKPPRLKPDAIWNSGCYRRLWELESAGIKVKGNHALVEQVFRHQKNYYNALRMYEAYKKAFGLGQTPT